MDINFQRQSLAQQVAAKLERDLIGKKWREQFPPERELCALLGVSRVTLRSALRILRRKGLIRTLSHHGTKIMLPGRMPPAREKSNRVGILLVRPPGNIVPPFQYLVIREAEHLLRSAGYDLVVDVTARRRGENLDRQLEILISREQVDCWVLYSVSAPIQRFFMRQKIPVLLLGSRYSGITLPSVDMDYLTVGRHAGYTLLRLGHGRVVYLAPEERLAGDYLGEQGIKEAFASWPGDKCSLRFYYHDGTVGGFKRVVDMIMTGRDKPTAFVIVHAYFALTLTGHLREEGLHIPADVSIICRDDADFLAWSCPPIARYIVSVPVFARRIMRAILSLLAGAPRIVHPSLIMPRFDPGGTVAPPT